jgi:hypothetical protein
MYLEHYILLSVANSVGLTKKLMEAGGGLQGVLFVARFVLVFLRVKFLCDLIRGIHHK